MKKTWGQRGGDSSESALIDYQARLHPLETAWTLAYIPCHIEWMFLIIDRTIENGPF